MLKFAQLPVPVAVQKLELMLVQLGQRWALCNSDNCDAQALGVLEEPLLDLNARCVCALVQHRNERPAQVPSVQEPSHTASHTPDIIRTFFFIAYCQ